MSNAPVMHHGVMISSTFVDVEDLRSMLIKAAIDAGLHPRAMEHDLAMPDADVIDNSLKMVREASAYVLLIGHRYGQRPLCAKRNPEGVSITELEFNEALHLGRPIQLFLLSDSYPVPPKYVDKDSSNLESLNRFRQRAQSMDGKGGVNRIYKQVDDQRQFEIALGPSMLALKQLLQGPVPVSRPGTIASATSARPVTASLDEHGGHHDDDHDLADFQRAMQSLFDPNAPLSEWASTRRWRNGLPPKMASALAGSTRVQISKMPELFLSEVIAPIESDLASRELVLADIKLQVRKRLVDGMGAALSLAMEPTRRRQFQSAADLMRVPAKSIVGMDIAVRKDALSNLEPIAGSVGDAVRSKHSAQPMIETGEGQDRRWGILGHFASMVSAVNLEGKGVRIESPADVDFWGGKFRAEALRGYERLLVVSGEDGHDRTLSLSDIRWLADVGIKTAILEGDKKGVFWLLDEPLLVGIATGFLAFLDRCLK